jgi:hypothetical protein
MKQRFGLAPIAKWRLQGRVSKKQRVRILSSTPFVTIVKSLAKCATISSFESERMLENTQYKRIKLIVSANAGVVDAWHNSRGGCRAQYYLSPRLGVAAERDALDALLPLIKSSIKGDPRSSLFLVSLKDQNAKIRIFGGQWIRRPRKTDRKLRVPEWTRCWQQNIPGKLTDDQKRARKLARWGALIPNNETRIEIKGGWVHGLTHESYGRPAEDKMNRPEELHKYGFT